MHLKNDFGPSRRLADPRALRAVAFSERPVRRPKNKTCPVSERRRLTPRRREPRPQTTRPEQLTHPLAEQRCMCAVSPLPALTINRLRSLLCSFLFAFELRTRGELGALAMCTRPGYDEHDRDRDR